MKLLYTLILLLFFTSVLHLPIQAQTDAITSVDTVQNIDSNVYVVDSVMMNSTELLSEELRYDGEKKINTVEYRTFEFYLFLIIMAIFGLIKLIDTNVYSNLVKRFLNTNLTVRPVKNMFQQVTIANYLLGILFFIISGLYLYYILDRWNLHPYWLENRNISLKMFFYIGCISVAYIIKLSFLSFMGYVFDLKRFTSEYSYSILLVQQVLGILLYPFLWMIVFMGESITKAGIIASVILFILAFLNRYARSRESIVTLLKLNKFHFFIYLCTSEIIPLLIIIKIMIG